VPSPNDRLENTLKLATTHGWHEEKYVTGNFDISYFLPSQTKPSKQLIVYIEGDGLAWVTKSRVSDNPTPVDPIGLKLALLDRAPSVYLARPCQYQIAQGCLAKYWTTDRFSEEVIAEENNALNRIKARFGATELTLVGYSGGAAVAALLAARRSDVHKLVTIAGNLDIDVWVSVHRLAKLTNSLNPSDAREQLEKIPQIHFIGGQDKIIDKRVIESFVKGFHNAPKVIEIPNYDHHCCWESDWTTLKEKYVD
jgi:dienelactone hydrolase